MKNGCALCTIFIETASVVVTYLRSEKFLFEINDLLLLVGRSRPVPFRMRNDGVQRLMR